jgi:hypothetical protein
MAELMLSRRRNILGHNGKVNVPQKRKYIKA